MGVLDKTAILYHRRQYPAFSRWQIDKNRYSNNNALQPQWREAGTIYVGGTLEGLTSKIGYLKRLGVTAIMDQSGAGTGTFPGNISRGYGIRIF